MSEDPFSPPILEVIEYQTEICSVIWIKNNNLGINFKGYGITLELPSSTILNNGNITIKYESDIGNPDFKFILD